MKYNILIIYLLAITLLSIILTVYDKLSAKAGGHRITEATLMLFGLFGGATGMYITMQLIRHKTKHLKFMIGLPIFIALHIAAAILIYIYLL